MTERRETGQSFVTGFRALRIGSGVLRTAHGELETPFFMPVGTQAPVKTLSPADLEAIGAEARAVVIEPSLDGAEVVPQRVHLVQAGWFGSVPAETAYRAEVVKVDEVADLVRRIGPGLVVALLLVPAPAAAQGTAPLPGTANQSSCGNRGPP